MHSGKEPERGFLPALKAETGFLFSGQGMPYEKVCMMVAMVVSLVLGIMLSDNIAKDAPIAIIDLDNSAYTRELTNAIDASEFMHVTAVLHTPVDPSTLFYEDKATAVVYFPRDLEKSRYTGVAANVGIYYDSTNTANSTDVRVALNQLVALDNAAASGDTGSTNDSIHGSLGLSERDLFNPSGSNYNIETLGFLFFFGTMFYVFATIGMVPRLRLTHELEETLLAGNPWELVARILPYSFLLLVSFVVGMAVMRVTGDLVFTGSLWKFLLVQLLFIPTVGVMNLLFGWSAANPGIASSRMILFIPGGFIFGGPTGPTSYLPDWVLAVSHLFPLTWEYHFVRDIVSRGAGLSDIAQVLGAFLLYMAVVGLVFVWRFYQARRALLQRTRQEEKHEAYRKAVEA